MFNLSVRRKTSQSQRIPADLIPNLQRFILYFCVLVNRLYLVVEIDIDITKLIVNCNNNNESDTVTQKRKPDKVID